MGFNIFDQDWKNILAFCTLLVGTIGYVAKWHIKLKAWVMTWPVMSISDLKRRVSQLEETVETKAKIRDLIGDLHTAMDQSHNKIMGKLTLMGNRLNDVEKGIAFNAADLAVLIGTDTLVFKTDEQGNWVQFSDGVKDALGLKYGEILGRNFSNAIESLQRRAFLASYDDAVRNKRNIDEKVVINGRRYHMKGRPMNYNGKGYIGYSGTLEPINHTIQ